MVKTILKPIKKEPEPKVPADLRKVLSAAPKAAEKWQSLTPLARRDFIIWIEEAKQPETRKRRVDSVPSRLASGKRRPCCFSLVPMSFHKALSGTPSAKAQWSSLTSLERREFATWVNDAKKPDERRDRVEKACLALAAGKRRL